MRRITNGKRPRPYPTRAKQAMPGGLSRKQRNAWRSCAACLKAAKKPASPWDKALGPEDYRKLRDFFKTLRPLSLELIPEPAAPEIFKRLSEPPRFTLPVRELSELSSTLFAPKSADLGLEFIKSPLGNNQLRK